jgi:hypothetical protein
MKDHKDVLVKLARTVKNGGGDIFRKNSIVFCKKSYGGYTIRKRRPRKNRTVVSCSRVQKDSFIVI